MIGRALARIAGPKVLIGVVAAAALALGLLMWRLDSARDDASAATQRANQYKAAHESTVQALVAEREEAQRRARLLAQTRDRADARADRIGGLQDALDDARAHGSQAYRDCLDVRLPGAIRERLRQYRSDPSAGDSDDAAARVDG